MLFENCISVLKFPTPFCVYISVMEHWNGVLCITVIISCLPAVLWFFAFCFPFSVPHCIFLGRSLFSWIIISSSVSMANPEL